MTNTPLNPDALDKAALAMCHYVVANREMGHGIRPVYHQYQSAKAVVSAYLAVAQTVVNSFDPRELNRRGWTCGCEPGNYDSCDECQSACNELANFLNRPEVNDA